MGACGRIAQFQSSRSSFHECSLESKQADIASFRSGVELWLVFELQRWIGIGYFPTPWNTPLSLSSVESVICSQLADPHDTHAEAGQLSRLQAVLGSWPRKAGFLDSRWLLVRCPPHLSYTHTHLSIVCGKILRLEFSLCTDSRIQHK